MKDRQKENNTLRFNVSEGYIYPSLVNLTTGAFAGSSYVNPDSNLKPETSLTYELGYRLKADDFSLDLTTFATNAENYIDHVSCSTADGCSGRRDRTYKNIGKADTHGLEIAANYQNWPWEVASQITLLRRKKNYEGVDTWDAGIPEIAGELGVKFNSSLYENSMALGLTGRFEGNTQELISTRRGFSLEENSGYGVLDSNITYLWDKQIAFHLTAGNLTNKRYHSATENLDAAGRHFRLKANFSF